MSDAGWDRAPDAGRLLAARDRRSYWAWLALAVCVLLVLSAARSPVVRAQGTTTRCEPLASTWSTDEQATVCIYVEHVYGLYGVDFQMDMAEMPAIAQVLDENSGTAGVQIAPNWSLVKQPWYSLFNEVDNGAGSLHYAGTMLNPAVAVTGSGPVACMRFQATQAGTFDLDFSGVTLSDRDGFEIPTTAHSCQVTFEYPTITSCKPAAQTWKTNQDATVCIYVEGVTGMYGADFQMGFPDMVGIATVADEEVGTAGVQIKRDNSWVPPGWVVFANESNNSTGELQYVTYGWDPAPEVNGSGPVACMRFQATQAGTFDLDFSGVTLSDRDGFEIPTTAHSCQVTFEYPTITSCKPAAQTWKTNQDATVCIYVEGVTGMYGADFQMGFPDMVGIATVADEEVGTAGVQIKRDNSWVPPGWVVFANESNNSTGELQYVTYGWDPAPEVNGSGPVACMRFQASQAGTFDLDFSGVTLSDRDGFEIPTTSRSCQVTFEYPTITRCEPLSKIWWINEQATVCIYVEGVTGMYGGDFEMSFPDMLGIATVVDENAVAPGVQILRVDSWVPKGWVVFANEADNTFGYLHYLTYGWNPAPEVNGSGPVACMRFQPVAIGTFELTFTRHDLSDRDGFLIGNTARSCSVEFAYPTSVTVSGFVARSAGRSIHFEWQTAQELDILGFNLYYATKLDAPKIRINSELIPTQGPPGSSSGAEYSYEEWDVPANRAYYWLEVVDIHGHTELHGPVTVKPLGK